jgi:hypothetical protein
MEKVIAMTEQGLAKLGPRDMMLEAIRAFEGKDSDAYRLTFEERMGDGTVLEINLHARTGHITVWWKGVPFEYVPMFEQSDDRTNDSTDATVA